MEDAINHGRTSAEISKNFIHSLDISDYQKQQILLGVAMPVDGNKGDFEGEPHLEAKCISDADIMDSSGGNYKLYQMLDWGNSL